MTETDTSLYDGPCEAGCQHFHGGEVRHHPDCGHYPESLTKVNDDKISALLARAEKAEAERNKLEEIATELSGAARFWMSEHDTAWNDAIDAALGEIPEHWCSGSQARDRIRALRKDIQNG